MQLVRHGRSDARIPVHGWDDGASPRGPLHLVLQSLALAAVYVGAARLGLMLGPVSTFATTIWPPTGIALAALLLGGRRLWPGVALGAFIANRWVGAPVLVALGISAGNTLEALAGAYLIRRVGGFRRSLDELRVVLALIALGAMASTAISATAGVSSLLLGGRISRGDLAETLRVWWLGDASADLLIAPLLLAWRQPRRLVLGARRIVEAAALGVAVIGVSLLVFGRPPPGEASRFIEACMLVPLLMWGALRFGMRGATATVFLASVIAVWGTAAGRGPFVEETLSRSLLYLQAFAVVTATAMLVLGALIAERASALRRAEEARRRSEMLASLGGTLNAESGLEEVLERSVSQLADLLGADDGALCLAEGNGCRLREAWELQPDKRIGTVLDLDRLPHSRLALEQRRPIYFTRSEAAGAETDLFAALGIEATLVATLVGEGGRFIGALYLSYWEDRFSRSSEDLDFVSAVAGLFALAVARAQVYEAQRSARLEARLAVDRLALSQSITSDLAAARTQAEVARVLLERGLKAFGARALSVSVPISEEELDLVQQVGYLAGTIAPWSRIRIDSDTPRAEAFRTGHAVWLECPDDAVRRYPHLEARFREFGGEAWAVIPMIGDERPLGVFTLAFPEPRTFSVEERGFISFLASKYGQALDRARVYEAEKDARLRAEVAEREARRIGLLQERLVAMVSHDLQNPLGALTIAVERLRKHCLHIEPWEQSMVALMARSAERMKGILAGVLDMASARHGGGIAVRPEPMSLADVCRDAIAEFEETKPGRGVLLRVEADDRGEWDPGRMAQVVSNLVANALQHSPEDATVEVRIRGSRQNLVLEVHDSGPPIPPEVLPLIFDPFARGPGEDRKVNVGLGLYIVREIARAHGGTVDVCSRADKGTSFAVKLPRSRLTALRRVTADRPSHESVQQ
jgi:K+-sensing histidine kinase KdpD